MVRRTPKVVTIEELTAMLAEKSSQPQLPIVRPQFAVLERSNSAFAESLDIDTPIRFLEPRFGLLRKGKLRGVINLIDRTLEAPTLVFLAGGTIIQPLECSGDFEIQGFMLESELLTEIFQNRLPPTFNGQVQDFFLSADASTIDKISQIFQSLIAIVKETDYNREVAKSLFAAILYLYDEAYRRHEVIGGKSKSRERELFDSFIPLVNQYARSEHNIAFYADKLCITERYLSRVVKGVSGLSAKEWIDRALITEAKVMLKHGNITVAGIADELNFPNPGFFNKFFKRLVGITPNAYREH